MRSFAHNVLAIVSLRDERHGPLPALLFVLTIVTGLVDAVSYLRLGHVFVANVTGNVVFLGFGLAGAKDVSVLEPTLAILLFAAGAVAGGRLGVLFGFHRGRLLAVTTLGQVMIVAVATVVAAAAGPHIAEPVRYALICMLSFTMGLQNASARRIAVPDMPTTVLTLTITALAADSHLAGGTQPRAGRRLVSVVAMLLGAGIGGGLVINFGITAALVAAVILLAITAAVVQRASIPAASWSASPT